MAACEPAVSWCATPCEPHLSVYKASYPSHSLALCRRPPFLPNDNLHSPSCLPLQRQTEQRSAFRYEGFTPKGLPLIQSDNPAPVAQKRRPPASTHFASYQPLTPATCRATPARPRDNLRTPGAIPLARNCAPSYCASPPPPLPCPPRDHRGAVTPVGQCPMSNVTINRASYQPMPQLSRDQCPWVPVQGYPYPWPPLESTTVYNASYMPPGCVTPPGYVPSRPATLPGAAAAPPCYA